MVKEDYYFGNPDQIRGVEECYLLEGKADGVRIMRVRNGLGLEVTVCPDRCADITRVIFKGDNMGYFAPCGYVSSKYYDANQSEMVRSFTGGFLTTCGLDNVGEVCEIDGITYPLHGRISNQPAKHCYWSENDDDYIIHAIISQAALFMDKMELVREIHIGKKNNTIEIKDQIQNKGDKESACMFMYHMNMGYPLLSEHAQLQINSCDVRPRNEYAREHISTWKEISEPGSMTEEACYYHSFEEKGVAKIYNPYIKKGVEISFDPESLPCFTEWKMMGKYDYVLGLEPGNCKLNGRKKVNQSGKLVMLKENEIVKYGVKIKLLEEA